MLFEAGESSISVSLIDELKNGGEEIYQVVLLTLQFSRKYLPNTFMKG